MTVQDPELKLRVEWDEVRSAYIDAKKNRAKDPDGYVKAKKKMGDMRRHWRGIREAVDEQVNEFAAQLGTINTKGSVK